MILISMKLSLKASKHHSEEESLSKTKKIRSTSTEKLIVEYDSTKTITVNRAIELISLLLYVHWSSFIRLARQIYFILAAMKPFFIDAVRLTASNKICVLAS